MSTIREMAQELMDRHECATRVCQHADERDCLAEIYLDGIRDSRTDTLMKLTADPYYTQASHGHAARFLTTQWEKEGAPNEDDET